MFEGLINAARNTLDRLRKNPLTVRVIRNTGYLFSANTLSAALSMAQSILAARLLGVEAFGLLGAITQFASVINRLTSFRMGELVVSYIGDFTAKGKDGQAAAVFKAAGLAEIASSGLAYGLLILIAPLGARYLAKDPMTEDLFVFYGLMILANLIVESATGLLQIFDKFRSIAVITVIQSLITLFLIGGAFLRNGQLREVVMAYLVGKFVWAGLITIAAFRLARQEWGSGWWRTPLSLLSDQRRELFRFAFSTNISGTINLVTRDSDVLWLSALSNPIQVGYYKVAKAFTNVLLIPVTPLISTTYREVAREVAGKQWQNVRYLLRSGSLISAAWTVPASLVLVLLGPWLIKLYGSGFEPSYPVLLILLIGVITVNILFWNRSVLLPMGMADYAAKASFVAAGVQIVLMLLLVPSMGAFAMAAALSLFFLLTAGVLVWQTHRQLRLAEIRAEALADR